MTGREVAVLRGHTVSPGVLAFSPDGSRLASGSPYPDNSVRLWDAATGRPIAALHGHTNTIRSVAFSPDGRRLVSGSLDQTARLWDGVNGQPVATLRGHTDRLWDAIFSPDGRRVVTASADRTLRLWDATSGDLIAVLLGHRAEVLGAAFAAHGSLLVSRSADGESRVWDMELAERNGILRGHGSFVYDVAFSPDGTRVASAAWDGTVRLWDATTGRQTAVLRHDAQEVGGGDRQFRGLAPRRQPARHRDARRRDHPLGSGHRQTPPGLHRTDRRTGPGTLERSSTRRARCWPRGVATARCGSGTWPRGSRPACLQGHAGSALDVAFSPDGTAARQRRIRPDGAALGCRDQDRDRGRCPETRRAIGSPTARTAA